MLVPAPPIVYCFRKELLVVFFWEREEDWSWCTCWFVVLFVPETAAAAPPTFYDLFRSSLATLFV